MDFSWPKLANDEAQSLTLCVCVCVCVCVWKHLLIWKFNNCHTIQYVLKK